MNSIKLINFAQHGGNNGQLVVIEGKIDIPFDIKRVFYIYGTDHDAIRGQHANKRSEFVLINLVGSCKIRVVDLKGTEEIYCLNKPHEGLYLPKMIWKDMFEFSFDSVLMVLASEHYDNTEYIRSFEDFVSEVDKRKNR